MAPGPQAVASALWDPSLLWSLALFARTRVGGGTSDSSACSLSLSHAPPLSRCGLGWSAGTHFGCHRSFSNNPRGTHLSVHVSLASGRLTEVYPNKSRFPGRQPSSNGNAGAITGMRSLAKLARSRHPRLDPRDGPRSGVHATAASKPPATAYGTPRAASSSANRCCAGESSPRRALDLQRQVGAIGKVAITPSGRQIIGQPR